MLPSKLRPPVHAVHHHFVLFPHQHPQSSPRQVLDSIAVLGEWQRRANIRYQTRTPSMQSVFAPDSGMHVLRKSVKAVWCASPIFHTEGS